MSFQIWDDARANDVHVTVWLHVDVYVVIFHSGRLQSVVDHEQHQPPQHINVVLHLEAIHIRVTIMFPAPNKTCNSMTYETTDSCRVNTFAIYGNYKVEVVDNTLIR